jgi:integrase/recombinase XerD
VVLNADEVVRFLEAVPSLRTRTALTTASAAGLRASEAVGLKINDIDSGRMVIRVEHGKGGKDRYVMLSAQLLRILRTYWRLARPADWLFPGRDATGPIDVQVLHSACRSACIASGLDKRVTVHTLRHSFATHPWRTAPTSASSRCCLATTTCRARRAIRRSRPGSSGGPRARLIA